MVGSGPSGLHFAASAIERGHEVVLVDFGLAAPEIPLPDLDFLQLKSKHPDAIQYFLGDDFSALSLPSTDVGEEEEYYGLPASKRYVFSHPERFSFRAEGMKPLVSFASGGLAECWTGGAYTFNDLDLKPFGFGYERMAKYYGIVAQRIGIGGAEDDLAPWYPIHEGLQTPIELDQSSAKILSKYHANKSSLKSRNPGIALGRSRQAAISAPFNGRAGCSKCGRCLWGCPNGAFYTPSLTLRELLKNPRFTYLPEKFASHFTHAGGRTLDGLTVFPSSGGKETLHGDAFVLACGTISSGNIFLRTLFDIHGEIVRLKGLMDNQQVLAPFINLSMIGQQYDPNSYQYHQLAVGMMTSNPSEFVHGQITTMKTASSHPIISQLPFGMRSGRQIFSILRSALGVVNLNFNDTRRQENFLTLDPVAYNDWPKLFLQYQSPENQQLQIAQAISRLQKFMRSIGAPLIPRMAQVRVPGASVHYSGTLPIDEAGGEFTVTEQCQSNDFDNLFIVDGSIFPTLPAKNLTFTLMANAARVASEAF